MDLFASPETGLNTHPDCCGGQSNDGFAFCLSDRMLSIVCHVFRSSRSLISHDGVSSWAMEKLMIDLRKIIPASFFWVGLSSVAWAGPFAPAAGQTGTTAVSKTDPAIVQWATGFANYLPGVNVDATWKTPEKALGSAQGTATDVVVLGDSGQITLTFSGSIFDGPGADFAVFENSFSDTFLELGWVEVSSNGVDYFRFTDYSFTPAAIAGFGSVDPTNIDGLAGKYRQGYGTPFDLSTLAGTAGLDINNVQYVRIIDIIGNGTQFDSYPANLGGPHPIYDPFPTSGTGGFDLDALGVMHFSATQVPEPGTYALLGMGLIMLWAGVKRRTFV